MRTFWRTMAALRLAMGLAPESFWRRGLQAGGFPESPITTWTAAELSRGNSVDIAEAGRELGRYDSRAWIAGLDAPGAVIVTTEDTAVAAAKAARARGGDERAGVPGPRRPHGRGHARRRVQRPAAQGTRRRARPARRGRGPLMELVRGEDGVVRCAWGDSTPEYRAYHDTEWGRPVTDDVRLFEKLCLEGFQSGLSWLTILRKREAFRSAFAGFDFEQVARYGERDVERLLGDAGIIRHRGKIEATINNARRAVELVEAEGSLSAFVWAFEPDPAGYPSEQATSAESKAAREGAQAPRLALRRPDDGLRLHAGDGPRQRPPRGLRRPRARAAGPRRHGLVDHRRDADVVDAALGVDPESVVASLAGAATRRPRNRLRRSARVGMAKLRPSSRRAAPHPRPRPC